MRPTKLVFRLKEDQIWAIGVHNLQKRIDQIVVDLHHKHGAVDRYKITSVHGFEITYTLLY